MILRAQNKLEPSIVLRLDEIFWQLDDAAKMDSKFREALKKSLDERGMLWPPIVWTQKTFLEFVDSKSRQDRTKPIDVDYHWRCAIGNNRLEYAKLSGYTEVECVVAETWQDKDRILSITRMEYRRDF